MQTFNVNSLNQLTTGTRSGTLTVAGTVGNPNVTPSVTVSGTGLTSGAATMHADGTWARAGATLADGANSYTATASAGGRSSVDSVSYTLPATVTFTYDGNGNLTSDGSRTFEYDFENQLTNVYVATKWRSEFVYDTLMRRRVRKEYTWQGGAWVQTNEVRYVYDQRLVVYPVRYDHCAPSRAPGREKSSSISADKSHLSHGVKERWYNPQISLATPQKLMTYTRGNDLSRDLQSAGGIGGLLARSDSSLMQSDPASAHVFYATDGNGNVTMLVNNNYAVVARYQYDPYGNMISMSGPMAEVNLYRFSSKELHLNSGLYYYGFRLYEPSLQRWLNRDPIGEMGGINLYVFAGNNGIFWVDAYGLHWTDYIPDFVVAPGTVNFFAGMGDYLSFGLTDMARDGYGINDAVDKCSGDYRAGEYFGMGLDLAMTGGSMALKAGAKNVSRSTLSADRSALRESLGLSKGDQLKAHHMNPLKGHPPANGVPATGTIFPTAALPSWLKNSAINGKALTEAEHAAAHQALRRAERVARGMGLANPVGTAGRLGADAARGGGCN